MKTPLRIGINALFLIPGEVGGTEYHLRSFLKSLEQLANRHEYVVFCNQENYDSFSFSTARWQKVLCPIKAEHRLLRLVYEQVRLPFLVRQHRCDILHSYGYWGTLINATKQVVTVHDTNWLDHPEDMPLLTRLVTKVLSEVSIAQASQILTDSDFGKSRLEHFFPSRASKFRVLLPGIEAEFQELLRIASTKPRPQARPYLLCVSALYPHKNIPYLLSAWQQVTETSKSYDLVLIGRRGLDESPVLSQIKHLAHIKYIPSLSLQDLASYYAHAQAFVFPSLYEGFGYPVYESLLGDLPCVVAEPRLYQSNVQPFLMKLDPEPTVAAQLLLKALTAPRQKTADFIRREYQYDVSALKLLKLYETL